MAFRDTAKDFVEKLPKHRDNLFYNTDGFVGVPDPHGFHRGIRNNKDDVMLVQHFLKVVAANPTKFKRPFHPPKKFPNMKVDGIYGDQTAAWIGAFQNHLHNLPLNVLRDGVVDRVRNGIQNSPNGFLWTMVMLNVTMGQVTGEANWDQWWKDATVPALLRDKVRNPSTFL